MPWSIFSSFDSLGNSVDIGNLLNGSGTFKKYYSNKKLKKIEEYSNGKYWNTIYYYSITGDSLNIGSIRDGTGDILEYFDTGNIKSKTSFKGGIRNGIYIEYNEKGIKILSGNYLDGYEEGDWELFDERGKLMAVYEYKHGNFISISDFEH